MTDQPIIEIHDLHKSYGATPVLRGCSLSVSRGEVVVVCGPSGSGKSTLIKCINGLEVYQSGSIRIEGIEVGAKGTDLPKLRARVGMVFQHFELYPHMSVLDNVALAQIQDAAARIPAQRPEKQSSEPHDVKVLELTGTPQSRREAALFVAANVCPEHAAIEGGRAMLLAQELLAQTVGQAVRAAHLTLTCTGHAVTLYVDLAAEHAPLERLEASAPDLHLVQVLADDCGAEALRPGVRYWATIET